ncbi:hypothetical protein M569_04717, partial [Genlisea aurea]
NTPRLSPLRPGNKGGSYFSPSRKSAPRGSPTFRRLNSTQTRRFDGKSGSSINSQCFRSNRVIMWLLLITLWAYAGFYFQSRWAHGDNKENFFNGGYGGENPVSEKSNKRGLIDADIDTAPPPVLSRGNNTGGLKKKKDALMKNLVNNKSPAKRKISRRETRRRIQIQDKLKETQAVEDRVDLQEEGIPSTNATYRFLVGPFGSLEDNILEWSPETRSGTCDRKAAFARLVWSRKFVLIFHELSVTGAPLAMLELASEFLSCGATISVVVLSKKGGLMSELLRRKIKVLSDKSESSFKNAMKADLIIAASAVCSSWIEQYLDYTVLGSSQILWWIMENRREYFDRSKPVLNRVKKLMFLSESQSKQWTAWCREENIQLNFEPSLVPLSLNDELAFVSGMPSSLNTPSSSTESMQEKRRALRSAVRREMGLNESDVLVVSLSSINPGKGQLLLLESANHLLTNHPDAAKHLKILIGSVGSKSSKPAFVKTLLEYLSLHPELSESVLWTPATTRVASLYAAADVCVMNSQGVGETFGRVTVEAMAFGLPVLGTDAGGTKEIVDHNETGLLHPLGRPGAAILAGNIEFLIRNGSVRREMGMRGREKVGKMYMKGNMYHKFGQVLYKCMRI